MIRLYDTNHAIAHLNRDPRLASHLADAEAADDRFAITTTVVAELYYGAYASQRVADNLAAVAVFLSQVIVYVFDEAAAEEFGKIQAEQRGQGKPIPVADAQIAAIARLRRLTLLTNDAHFSSVSGLMLENWLV